MHFETLADFIDMGGYGFYVWLSYGAAFALLMTLTIMSVRGRQSLFKKIRAKQMREQKLKAYRTGNNNEPKT